MKLTTSSLCIAASVLLIGTSTVASLPSSNNKWNSSSNSIHSSNSNSNSNGKSKSNSNSNSYSNSKSSSNENSNKGSNSHKVTKATESSYTFDATSDSNVAVYFGRTDETANTNLTAQCQDENVDIVILAFLTNVFGGGDYPDMAFDYLCSGQTDEMVAAGATGLLSCTDLAPQIQTCQSLGKKVLLGIGGANGNTTFATTALAESGATLLWNLFGGGSGEASGLLPFGAAKVDGFDIDNETGDGDNYEDFATKMRALYATQSAKTYYLSAAPTCSLSDTTHTHTLLNLMDWVWPQFYAAPSCNIGGTGFSASITAWSSRLSGPKLYIGSPAWSGGTSNGGYQEPDDFATTIKSAKELASSNFGGVMLWDGAYGHITEDSEGNDYISVSKTALES